MKSERIRRAYHSNAISRKADFLFNAIFTAYCLICVSPILLIFMVSISNELSLVERGYSFFPTSISLTSYRYLFADPEKILRAYGVSIAVCVSGTALSVLMTMLYAYPISRASFKYRNFFSFYIFFTMLFSGGLVPTYIMYSSYFHLINNPVMLVVPGLVSAFNVLVVRTFFRLNIPDSVLESARMDGASEFLIFFRIVAPLSTPAIATIGLFSVLMYWNDWYSCLLYINDAKYYNIQYAMYQALRTIEYLTSSSANMNMANFSGEMAKVPAESLRMAMAIIGIGPIVFAYPFFQRYFIKGLTLGAVKE
ncbi:MAG: carbohydrate ABC transporter permease [Clostridiales bacterium]|jgi:putative aldouronate transport system permease protein|nr:carbohydrate ABC transporter permease [Clostridiales bacterium]